MSLLARHLFGRLLGALLLSALGLAALLWLLQLLRVGHHLAGASLATLGWLVLLSLPSLLIFVLPVALLAAGLLVLRGLEASGQLLAMQAAGMAPLQIARPLVLIALLGSGLLLGLGALEPGALSRLQERLERETLRSLVLEATPGQFHRLDQDTTFYLERQLPRSSAAAARFSGFLLARSGQLLLAAEASVAQHPQGGLRLRLRRGELQLRAGQGLQRIQFGSFASPLALAPSRLWSFLGAQRQASSRAPAQAGSLLALALLAAALGLSRQPLARRVLSGGACLGVQQAALAALAGSGLLVQLAPSAGLAAGSLLWLTQLRVLRGLAQGRRGGA